MTKMLLPDLNVWLALTFDSHIHHPAAADRRWIMSRSWRSRIDPTYWRLRQPPEYWKIALYP